MASCKLRVAASQIKSHQSEILRILFTFLWHIICWFLIGLFDRILESKATEW
jgi:hypothetical protein